MADDAIEKLIAQGLQAARSGGEVAKAATADIERDASSPELKAALQRGNETAARWQQRVEQALAETGASGSTNNPILEAHFDVSKRIRANASDARSRDLGIIAAGQLALHYWIASFGTLRTYAASAELAQTRDDMQRCLDEAKAADSEHTEIALQMLQKTSA